jgi:hypothetical protein
MGESMYNLFSVNIPPNPRRKGRARWKRRKGIMFSLIGLANMSWFVLHFTPTGRLSGSEENRYIIITQTKWDGIPHTICSNEEEYDTRFEKKKCM